MSENQINPAGVFLRTLREGSRAGAQALGGAELPVRRVLVALQSGGRSRQQLLEQLAISRAALDETLRNLASLDLVQSSGLGKEEVISLTELGKEVASKG